MRTMLKVAYLADLPPGVGGDDGPWASLHKFEVTAPYGWDQWSDREREEWVFHVAVLGHVDRTYRQRPRSLEFDFEVLAESAH